MKVKNILKLLFVLAFALIFTNKVSAKDITLDEIVDSFNASTTIADINSQYDSEHKISASVNGNELHISMPIMIDDELANTGVTYKLNGNILSYDYLTIDTAMSALYLADSIAKLHGYEYGDLLINYYLYDDEMMEFNINDDGFEFIKNDSYVAVKMDITKKYPLVDINDVYLRPSDFDIIKDIIENNSAGNQNGKQGNISYNIIVGAEENTIIIGEVSDFTDNTYKSILSALEVLYGQKAVDYFKSIYPEIKDNAYIDGIDINTNYEVDTVESPIYAGAKVLQITIDNDFAKDLFLRTEYIGEEINGGSKELTLDFSTNPTYEISAFESIKTNNLAFFIRYVLSPIVEEANIETIDDTIYFNIVDGKIVVSDKDNSIFKLTFNESSFIIDVTNNDVVKTTVTTKYNAVSEDHDICDYDHNHVRYIAYNFITNITYGNKIAYEVLNGDKQTVDLTKTSELTFRFDIPYAKFLEEGKVYVDGVLIDKSNYTSKEGSTIITFNSDYTKKLSATEHTLKVAVADGEVETTFNITKNPNTGDNIIVYISLLGLSALGLVFIKKYFLNK